MRRLSFFTLLAGLMLPASGLNLLFGQHQSGGHSGHGGPSSGGVNSGRSQQVRSQPSGTTISTLSRGRNPSAGQLIYPTNIGLQQQFSGYTGINRGAIPNSSGHGGPRGYGYGFVGFAPYYYSTWGDDYASPSPYSYNDPVQDQAVQTANATANLLGEQVQRLSSEVVALQQEREAGNAPVARVPYQDPPAPIEDEARPEQPPLMLVLKSGKQLKLKSYAVMGQDIWDFSAQTAKRIAVSSIDINASKSATEAAGGEFPEIQ